MVKSLMLAFRRRILLITIKQKCLNHSGAVKQVGIITEATLIIEMEFDQHKILPIVQGGVIFEVLIKICINFLVWKVNFIGRKANSFSDFR